jgi:hypothetical protein
MLLPTMLFAMSMFGILPTSAKAHATSPDTSSESYRCNRHARSHSRVHVIQIKTANMVLPQLRQHRLSNNTRSRARAKRQQQ